MFNNSITIGPNISSGVYRASHDHALLIGGSDDNILLYGKMGPNTSDKELTVVQAKLKVTSSTESDSLIIKHDQNAFGTDKVATVINKRDVSADHPDGGLVFTFTGANGNENTVMSMRHTDVPMSNSNSFSVSSPARPLVGISGDINVLGRINFADGSSMDTNASGVAPNPGVGLSLSVVSGINTFDVNIEELAPAETQYPISDMNSYMSISTNGSVGKINISSLAGYIEVSGAARILANQNHIFSNTSIINPNINQYLHAIGYKAGHNLVESDYGVMLGSEAGSYSTTAVSGVDSSVFIGNRAGYDANAADNSVFIGPNAGNDAEDSRMSVFIGNSAGRDAKSAYSIGIGDNALESASGYYNLELITKQSQKLVVNNQSSRLNIGGAIAGSLQTQRISVGEATIVPSAVLHVNYNSITHATTPNMQEWHVDGVKKASVNTFGAFDNVVEGVLDTDLSAPTGPTSPTSGEMILYGQNWTSGIHIFVTNRDSSLSGYDGAYIMAVKIGNEYRPMWMGCQGT